MSVEDYSFSPRSESARFARPPLQVTKILLLGSNRFIFLLVTGLLTLSFCSPVFSEFSSSLTVQETVLTNKTESKDESGGATRISPGMHYQWDKRLSRALLDYSYNIEIYHGLDRDDSENQSLQALYEVSHIPGHWTSSIKANVRQSSINPDGKQSLGDIFSFGTTKELRTYGVSTRANNTFGQSINVGSILTANLTDFEDADNATNLGISLAFDNKVTRKKIYWDLSLQSQMSESVDTSNRIDSVKAGLNYRINRQYTAYITSQSSRTENSSFDDASTLLGLRWQPNQSAYINIAAGVRGNENSYSLDTTVIRKKLQFSLNYNETITTLQNEIQQIDFEDNIDLDTTFQSISIEPVFQKKLTGTLSVNGKKSNLALSLFSQIRSTVDLNSEEEKTDGVSFTLGRRLGRKSSVSFQALQQISQTTIKNDLRSTQISYSRSISRNAKLSGSISSSLQKSDNVENEYEQNNIGVTFTASF